MKECVRVPRAAVISASDRSSRGEREDLSGRLLGDLVRRIPASLEGYRVVPDQVRDIRSAIRSLSRSGGMDLILTTGGTGVSSRDVTPEATEPLIDRELPALSLAIRWASYEKAPASIISRAVAGFRGECLVVNMPGSPRAVRECFEVILPVFRWLFSRKVIDSDFDRLS
jgi:molybdenum cofactor synthesis domain-containing protein